MAAATDGAVTRLLSTEGVRRNARQLVARVALPQVRRQMGTAEGHASATATALPDRLRRMASGRTAQTGRRDSRGPRPGPGGVRREPRGHARPTAVQKANGRPAVARRAVRASKGGAERRGKNDSIPETPTATPCSRACPSSSSPSLSNCCVGASRRCAPPSTSNANGPVKRAVLSRAPKAYWPWRSRSFLA